jgi:hypothetical protein
MLVKLMQSFQGSAAGKVMDVPDDEAKTLCEKGIADPAGDDALAPIITKVTDALMAKVNDSVGVIVDATLKRFADAQSQARRGSAPAIFGEGGSGDPKKNFGDWLRNRRVRQCLRADRRSAETHVTAGDGAPGSG